MTAAVLGPAADGTPPRERAAAAVGAAGLHRAQAAVAVAITRGEPLEQAICDGVSELAMAVEWEAAWSLA